MRKLIGQISREEIENFQTATNQCIVDGGDRPIVPDYTVTNPSIVEEEIEQLSLELNNISKDTLSLCDLADETADSLRTSRLLMSTEETDVNAVELATESLNIISSKLGIKNKLEERYIPDDEKFTVATEGLGEIFSKIWEAIKKLWFKFVDWVQKMWDKLLVFLGLRSKEADNLIKNIKETGVSTIELELDKNGIGVITYTKKGETVTLPRESLNFTKFFTALVYIYSTDSRSYTYSKNVKDLLRRYTNDLSVLHANTTGKLGLVDMFNNALSDIFEFGDLDEAGESIGIFMENLFNNRGLSVIRGGIFANNTVGEIGPKNFDISNGAIGFLLPEYETMGGVKVLTLQTNIKNLNSVDIRNLFLDDNTTAQYSSANASELVFKRTGKQVYQDTDLKDIATDVKDIERRAASFIEKMKEEARSVHDRMNKINPANTKGGMKIGDAEKLGKIIKNLFIIFRHVTIYLPQVVSEISLASSNIAAGFNTILLEKNRA